MSPLRLKPLPVLTLSDNIFRSVDFPAPEAPIMNIACPGATYPVTLLIIFFIYGNFNSYPSISGGGC